MKTIFLIISLTILTALMSGCFETAIDSEELMKADKLIYKFKDSSVPPQYHRSYEITVTKTKAKIVVDSYGDVLSKEEVELKDRQFAEVLKAVKKAEITIASSKSGDGAGCTGGTSEYLDIFVSEKKIVDGGIYNCGKEGYGNMSGDLDILSDRLKSLFPNFEKLLKR